MKKFIIFCFILLGTLSVAHCANKRVRGNGGQAYGCVTDDTLITLASGKEIPVSLLESECFVFNGNFDEVQVFYTIQGPENDLMYILETRSGKKIKATKGHPFYSSNGIVAAKNFKEGSDILTIDGFEKIISVSTFKYYGEVYNLAVANVEDALDTNLESKDPFLGLSSSEHSVILNGFISGDILIQRLLAK